MNAAPNYSLRVKSEGHVAQGFVGWRIRNIRRNGDDLHVPVIANAVSERFCETLGKEIVGCIAGEILKWQNNQRRVSASWIEAGARNLKQEMFDFRRSYHNDGKKQDVDRRAKVRNMPRSSGILQRL